jgi:hypothetical protein
LYRKPRPLVKVTARTSDCPRRLAKLGVESMVISQSVCFTRWSILV